MTQLNPETHDPRVVVSRPVFHECWRCTYVKARVWVPPDVADVPAEETTARQVKPVHADLDLIDQPVSIWIPLISNTPPSGVAQQHGTRAQEFNVD